MPGDPEQCRFNAGALFEAGRARHSPREAGENPPPWRRRGQDWPPSFNPTKRFSAHFLTWNLTSLATRCPRL